MFVRGFITEALGAYKANLAGLPSFCRLTMYSLMEYCDYSSGVITIGSLDDLARQDFYVAPSPGRKKEPINGDTLRNAFRTIKKAKPNHFIFTTKNQRIVIEMPFLRELYEEFHNKSEEMESQSARNVAECENFNVTEENIGLNINQIDNAIVGSTPVSLCLDHHVSDIEISHKSPQVAGVDAADDVALTTDSSIESYACLEANFFAEDETDLAAATSCPIRDINKINNNNNIQKLPISESFVPNQETITRAQILGYDTVTDFQEIQAFIDHNKAIGSLWADYNPIYIRWLAKSVERKQQQKLSQTISGRINYATSRQRQTPRPSARERVKQAYASQYEFDERTGCFEAWAHTST